MPCPPGRYSRAAGSNSSACEGTCTAGFYCPGASVSATEVPCAAGYFGDAPGAANASCTGPCVGPAGLYCGPGSTSPVPLASCPPGSFCPGIGPPRPCTGVPGFWCPGGLSSAAGALPCAAGYYGSAGGSYGTPACAGPCTPRAGRACPPGSNSIIGTPCVGGTYNPGGSAAGCAVCPPGTASASVGGVPSATCTSCGPLTYAPPGSPACLPCSSELFAIGSGAHATRWAVVVVVMVVWVGGGVGVGGDDVSGSHRACTRSGRPCPARAGNRKRHCGVDRPQRQNFVNAARRVDGGGREPAGGPRRRARGGHGGQRLHAHSSARGQCDAERGSARPGARLR